MCANLLSFKGPLCVWGGVICGKCILFRVSFGVELWAGCKLATYMLLLIQGYILLKSQFVLNQSETFNRCSKLAPNSLFASW